MLLDVCSHTLFVYSLRISCLVLGIQSATGRFADPFAVVALLRVTYLLRCALTVVSRGVFPVGNTEFPCSLRYRPTLGAIHCP